MSYLIDTSAYSRVHHQPVAARLAGIGPARLYFCTAVLLEIGISTRNGVQHAREVEAHTTSPRWLPMSPFVEQRAIQIQGLLAARGHHRSARMADLFIAAVAEANHLTVLHYDSDFDLVAEVTGQPCEWVVERGSVS